MKFLKVLFKDIAIVLYNVCKAIVTTFVLSAALVWFLFTVVYQVSQLLGGTMQEPFADVYLDASGATCFVLVVISMIVEIVKSTPKTANAWKSVVQIMGIALACFVLMALMLGACWNTMNVFGDAAIKYVFTGTFPIIEYSTFDMAVAIVLMGSFTVFVGWAIGAYLYDVYKRSIE